MYVLPHVSGASKFFEVLRNGPWQLHWGSWVLAGFSNAGCQICVLLCFCAFDCNLLKIYQKNGKHEVSCDWKVFLFFGWFGALGCSSSSLRAKVFRGGFHDGRSVDRQSHTHGLIALSVSDSNKTGASACSTLFPQDVWMQPQQPQITHDVVLPGQDETWCTPWIWKGQRGGEVLLEYTRPNKSPLLGCPD